MNIYKKDNSYFELKSKTNKIGVFYNLDENKKRILSKNNKGQDLQCVDGTPRYDKSIITYSKLIKL